MASALFIVPECEVPDLEIFVNGKALAHSDRLDELAARAGVTPLMEFFSQDPAELEEFLEGEGIEPPDVDMPPTEWFPAEAGLTTVRGLISSLEADPAEVSDAAALLDDLREFDTVLGALAARGVRWRLAVDI